MRALLGILHALASSAALFCLLSRAPLLPTAATLLLAFGVIVARTLLFGPTAGVEVPPTGDRHATPPNTDRDRA